MTTASEELQQLLEKMIVGKQLSASDARHLAGESANSGSGLISTEEDVLDVPLRVPVLAHQLLRRLQDLLGLLREPVLSHHDWLLPCSFSRGITCIGATRLTTAAEALVALALGSDSRLEEPANERSLPPPSAASLHLSL